jgi:multidrug transporter EmrE-like cation transporter
MSFLCTIVLLSIAEVFGDFGFKSYARTGATSAFGQGTMGYLGVIYFLIKGLRTSNVLYLNGCWDASSAIIESLAAYFIFGERLNSPSQYFGIVFIILGLFMLRVPDGMKIPFD